jgi:hypothetical protein
MNEQIVICENCGTEWRVWGFGRNAEIMAELVTCPMCDYKDCDLEAKKGEKSQ